MEPPFSKPDFSRYARLTYSRFRELAQDKRLSPFEKIGFPDQLRASFEQRIFEDICSKLSVLRASGQTVVDIGSGCGGLPQLLANHCLARDHRLILIDSPEMLALIPDVSGVIKMPGRFPRDFNIIPPELESGADAVLVYSVLQHIMLEDNVFAFVDAASALLKPGGMLLLGDIPNASKRARFLQSEAGIAFHKKYMDTDEPPATDSLRLEIGAIDDAVVAALVARARSAGFEAYILPQSSLLPFANRREDILISRH